MKITTSIKEITVEGMSYLSRDLEQAMLKTVFNEEGMRGIKFNFLDMGGKDIVLRSIHFAQDAGFGS